MMRFLVIPALFIVAFFTACSDDNTSGSQPTPQPVEVVAPADVKSADGVERVKISWKQNVEAEIAKSIIYWNDRKSYKTITFKAQQSAGMQKDSIIIDRLDEGDYTFEIVNIDKQNNQSAFKSVSAHAYGDDHISTLETRPTKEMTYDKESRTATITWGEEWDKGLGTEITNDSEADDAPAAVWVKNSDLTTAISPLDDGAKLKIQTLYCPDNCLDTMRSAAVTLVVKAPEEEGGDDVEDTRPLTNLTNLKGYDGFKRVKLSWEQAVESSVEKTRIIWGLTEDQMCEKVFERTEQSGSQKEEIFIDLPEGEYTFSIVNVDKAGNKTEAVEVKARAYGDTYLSTLTTRSIEQLAYDADNKLATLTLGSANSAGGMVNSRVRYKHTTSGEEIIKSAGNRVFTVKCENIGSGEKLELYSNYCPANCIDTMQSAIISRTTDHIVDVKVMQLNICRDQTLGSYSWAERKAAIADLVKTQQPDVICLQEINPYDDAFNEILGQLNNSYDKNSWSGDLYSGTVCRRGTTVIFDDESEAIIYRNAKFELVNRGMFWLSNTPDQESRMSVTIDGTTYNANYKRIAVWNILREKTSGKEICVAATHIDNKNDATQESLGFPIMWQQVQICVNNIEAKAKDANGNALPIIIAGDMNANPDKAPILRFTNTNKYTDTYVVAQTRSCPDSEKPRSTMVDVNGASATQNWAAFDYIFAKGGTFTIPNHTIHPPKHNGITLSDHNAVSATIRYRFAE